MNNYLRLYMVHWTRGNTCINMVTHLSAWFTEHVGTVTSTWWPISLHGSLNMSAHLYQHGDPSLCMVHWTCGHSYINMVTHIYMWFTEHVGTLTSTWWPISICGLLNMWAHLHQHGDPSLYVVHWTCGHTYINMVTHLSIWFTEHVGTLTSTWWPISLCGSLNMWACTLVSTWWLIFLHDSLDMWAHLYQHGDHLSMVHWTCGHTCINMLTHLSTWLHEFLGILNIVSCTCTLGHILYGSLNTWTHPIWIPKHLDTSYMDP